MILMTTMRTMILEPLVPQALSWGRISQMIVRCSTVTCKHGAGSCGLENNGTHAFWIIIPSPNIDHENPTSSGNSSLLPRHGRVNRFVGGSPT